jgi:DNA-directed RNA polymerase subunit M/transcription elongation factor TFIIS
MLKYEREKAIPTDGLFCEDGHILVNVKIKEGHALYCQVCDKYYILKNADGLKIMTNGGEGRDIAFIDGVTAPVDSITVSYTCPECGNKKAYRWTMQIGHADEEPHEFNMCTKCGHVEKHGWQL